MKTSYLAAVALSAAFGLQAQTNSLEKATVPASPAPATESSPPAVSPTRSLPAAPASAAPTPRAPGDRNSIRNQSTSRHVEAINASLDAQKPRPKGAEARRVNGLVPAATRTVKAKGNLLQLINPFAPMSEEEKNGVVERSRVFDDPRSHANSGIDILSVSYSIP
jgi:hypothetical protein